jgi:hypothetical protein
VVGAWNSIHPLTIGGVHVFIFFPEMMANDYTSATVHEYGKFGKNYGKSANINKVPMRCTARDLFS